MVVDAHMPFSLDPLADIPLFWLETRIAEEIRDFHNLLWIDPNKCGPEGVFLGIQLPQLQLPLLPVIKSMRRRRRAVGDRYLHNPPLPILIIIHTTSDRTDWGKCTCKIQALVSPVTIEWVCTVPTDARNRQSDSPEYTTRATMTEKLIRRQKSGRPPPSSWPTRIAESTSCEVHKH